EAGYRRGVGRPGPGGHLGPACVCHVPPREPVINPLTSESAMKATSPWRVFWFAAGLAICCAGPGRAAGPRDELLRLVPDDVALCMVVQDLREHTAALSRSPLAADFRESWIGKAVRLSPELTRLAEMEKQFKDATAIDWSQLRDEILGDCI